MLRIHFTNDDLARTRIVGKPDPMWETLLSLHLLQQTDGAEVFGQWRARVRPRVTADTASLFELAPPKGYSVDFLTPTGAEDLEAGIDTVLSTPRDQLRSNVITLTAGRRPAPQLRAVSEGCSQAMGQLGAALRGYYDVALAPFWPEIQRRVEADRALRAQTLLDHGLGHLLNTLHPAARWTEPVLSLPYGEGELRLDGRGLVLVPSFFCWGKPIGLRDPLLAPVVVYPIKHELGWAVRGDRPERVRSVRPLAALLGRTRAAALEVIAGGCTTTGLAQRLGISLAAASEHTTVLRAAGLVTTLRKHRAAHHFLTPAGTQLLCVSLAEHPA